jgi:hypothetical protein
MPRFKSTLVNQRLRAIVAVILVLLVAPLASAQSGRQRPPAPPSAPCTAGETNFFRDEAMTMKLATKLQFNKELLRERIEVATLSGAVTTQGLVHTAGKVAGEIEGIRCVNNRLVVGVAP